jgi:hypothetical protein
MTALADSPAAWQDRRAYPGPGDASANPDAVSGPVLRADQSGAARDRVRTVRSWVLVLLAFPAAAEVRSGWVGIAQKTGFGLVSPLPGIWSSLHLDTTITLPIGVEAYAAYALRAWLATDPWISTRTRRFAKWSAICSFALGMAGQVAYHLLVQAGEARAPWGITTVVSCLPAGPGPWHGDRAGPHAARRRHGRGPTGQPVPRAAQRLVPGQVRRGPVRGPAGPPTPDQDHGPDWSSPRDQRPSGGPKPGSSRRDQAPGPRSGALAEGDGAPCGQGANRCGETRVTAGAARRRSQGVQRGPEYPRPHDQCRATERGDSLSVASQRAGQPRHVARPIQLAAPSGRSRRSGRGHAVDAVCRQANMEPTSGVRSLKQSEGNWLHWAASAAGS